MGYTDEDIAAYRAAYPKACYKCGGELAGPPPTNEEIREMLQEHDLLFPGKSIDTSCVICEKCFQTYVPDGKTIGFN